MHLVFYANSEKSVVCLFACLIGKQNKFFGDDEISVSLLFTKSCFDGAPKMHSKIKMSGISLYRWLLKDQKGLF